MNYRTKVLALSLLMGMGFPFSVSASVVATPKQVSSESRFVYEGWEIKANGYRTTGKTAQTENTSYTAEQTWLIVSASIRKVGVGGTNHPPLGFVNAQLVDTNGFYYPLTRIEYKSRNIGEPFKPGEIRLEDLMFDVPQGTRARFLIIYSPTQAEVARIKI